MAIAHGYAKVTEQPLLAIVHSNVGLMHASMAVYNAWCDRLPGWPDVLAHIERVRSSGGTLIAAGASPARPAAAAPAAPGGAGCGSRPHAATVAVVTSDHGPFSPRVLIQRAM